MATQPTAKEDREARETETHGKSPLVVVELARRRSPDQVRRLRKGHGKLVTDIEDTVEELVKSGTIKAEAQPVVIVVREAALPLMWALDEDEEDDDDDDEDEDDDD
jgi:nitrous oxide reductase